MFPKNNDLKRLATPKALIVPPLGGIDQYTKLMLHGDSLDTIVDRSKNNCSLTNTSITLNSAGEFEANAYTDRLSVAGVLEPLGFGTGNFTCDFYYRGNPADKPRSVFYSQTTGSIKLYYNGANLWAFAHPSFTSPTGYRDINGLLANDSNEHHYAIVREGTGTDQLKFYRDGQVMYTTTFSGSVAAPENLSLFGEVTHTLVTGTSSFRNLRFSNTARWTAPFTPPTTASPDEYAQLLITRDSYVNPDSSLYGKAITNSGVTVSTTQSKFGGKSLNIPSSSSYLSVATDSDFNMGTGDFTVEGWWFFTNSSAYKTLVSLGRNGTGEVRLETDNSANNIMSIRLGSGALLTDPTINSPSTLIHYAMVKSSGTYILFRNGLIVGSIADSTPINPSTYPYVFVGGQTGVSYSTVGFIDEVRISKGIARWTSNFTPPDRPYTILN